jgi:DNA-binding NarL/FixJ family response regulator
MTPYYVLLTPFKRQLFRMHRDPMEPKSKLRIVLIQEHEVLRDGLEILLTRQGELSVVGSFDNISDALDSIPKLQPDLVLTDWQLAGQTVADLLAETRRLVPACKNLVLSSSESQGCVRAALQAGADGFIVLFAIRAVAGGRQFICNSTATRILTAQFSGARPVSARAMAQGITGREREVLTRIALGNSNKAIARELGVSPKTVEKHRSNLMRKLQLHNAAAITMYAIRNGMTSGDPFAVSSQAPRLASGAN